VSAAAVKLWKLNDIYVLAEELGPQAAVICGASTIRRPAQERVIARASSRLVRKIGQNAGSGRGFSRLRSLL
jgi:hypothetical protein